MKSLFHKSKPQNTRSLLGSSSKLQSYMPIIQPLSQDFFGDLMKLENMFYRSKYTVETLDNLVQLYAKAVEYYDGIRDGISTYFMFKIQDILATKQSLKMLIDRKDETTTENGSTQSEKDKTHSESFSNGLPQGQIINFIKQDYFTEQNSALKAASGKTENQAFECIRSQRQKLFQFNQRFEAEVATAKRCIQELFEEFKETAVQLDEVVLNNVNQQKQRLYKKLERKRNQDLISYAMNESSNSLLSFQSLIDNNGRKEYAINILQAELSEEENLADKKEIVRDDQNLQIKVKPNLLSSGGLSVDQSSAESSFTITETNNSDKTEIKLNM